METIWRSGVDVIVFLQALGEWLTPLMMFFSFLGVPQFYLLFMPALYWCLDVGLGIRLGAILMLSSGLNNALKIAFHGPRPYWFSRAVRAWGSNPSFGLPSGHAQNSVSFWGLLALSLRKGWAWGVALALMLLIGLSRMYLGVHFPTDVIVGWLIGALLLGAFLRWEDQVVRWLRERSLGQQLVVAFLASLVLVAFSVLSIASLGSWQMPAAWVETSMASAGEVPEPLIPTDALTAGGAVFGLAAGAAWLSRVGGFRPDGPAVKRLGRYLLGMVGVFALWYGLKTVFPPDDILLGRCLRYLRYALIGGWISAGAPVLFLRLGLADRGNWSVSGDARGLRSDAVEAEGMDIANMRSRADED